MAFKKVIYYCIEVERRSIQWKATHGITILRVCLGVVFIWFGCLKFFPGLSSAEDIAGTTVLKLTRGFVTPEVSMPVLAIWECLIGIGLIFKSYLSFTLLLLYLQMVGTFLPLIFFPKLTFEGSILVPTLLGQYIIKNIVLLSSAVVIGATALGGSILNTPNAAYKMKRFDAMQKLYKRGLKGMKDGDGK